MADLQCRLQETVYANRETLNNRAEDQRIKEEVTQSRGQQPGTAQAQQGTRQPTATAPQTAQAQRKPTATPAVNDQAKTNQQTRLKQADKKQGVARLPVLRKELGVRRLDGVELDSIFITYNSSPSFNVGGGLLFYEGHPDSLADVEIVVFSAVNGELARFNPYALSALSEPSETPVEGEQAAIEAYVNSLSSTSLTNTSYLYTQRGSMGLDFPVVVNNKLSLVFLRQRWVRYTGSYQLTVYGILGNPISVSTVRSEGIPDFTGDALVVNIDLPTGAISHSANVFQTHSITNVRDAVATTDFTGGGSLFWVFNYSTKETLDNIAPFIAEATGLSQTLGSCAVDLFTTSRSADYVYEYDTAAAGNQRILLPSQVTPARADVDNGGVLIHSAVLLMSDPDRRYRGLSWLAQPRWAGLSTSDAVRVLVAAGDSAADYLEASEYDLDLSNCEQVAWLDDYWAGSFAAVNVELAEPSEVFVQDQITLPSDGPVGDPVIEPINPFAPPEPYEATVVKNIPYINRNALAQLLGGEIAWVVYRVL